MNILSLTVHVLLNKAEILWIKLKQEIQVLKSIDFSTISGIFALTRDIAIL
jgi:hypothetical protein